MTAIFGTLAAVFFVIGTRYLFDAVTHREGYVYLGLSVAFAVFAWIGP